MDSVFSEMDLYRRMNKMIVFIWTPDTENVSEGRFTMASR